MNWLIGSLLGKAVRFVVVMLSGMLLHAGIVKAEQQNDFSDALAVVIQVVAVGSFELYAHHKITKPINEIKATIETATGIEQSQNGMIELAKSALQQAINSAPNLVRATLPKDVPPPFPQ